MGHATWDFINIDMCNSTPQAFVAAQGLILISTVDPWWLPVQRTRRSPAEGSLKSRMVEDSELWLPPTSISRLSLYPVWTYYCAVACLYCSQGLGLFSIVFCPQHPPTYILWSLIQEDHLQKLSPESILQVRTGRGFWALVTSHKRLSLYSA